MMNWWMSGDWDVPSNQYHHEVHELRYNLRKTKENLAYREEELRKLFNEYQKVKFKLFEYHKQNHDLVGETKRQLKEVRRAEEESQLLKQEKFLTTGLLETRTLELEGAQTFLTRADLTSGADVMALVEELNTEILQASAVISDSFEFANIPDEGEGLTAYEQARDNLKESLGERMLDVLRSKQHQNDPIFVQIALQARLATFMEGMVSAWVHGNPDQDALLNNIYSRVKSNENQAVAGRWRALTRTQLQEIVFNKDATLSVLIKVTQAIADVLIVTGVTTPASELFEMLKGRYGGRIEILVKLALRVRKVVYEDITSADLQTVSVRHGEPFNKEFMEDNLEATAPGEIDVPGVVLCLSEIGLRRVVKKVDEGASGFDSALLIKPKVVLDAPSIEDQPGVNGG